MKTVKIPRYIDSMPMLFFWELDELSVSFSFGVFLGGFNTMFGLIAGLFFVNVFRKYKAGGLPGQLNHILHWNNIISINMAHPRGGMRRMFK